MSHNQHKRSSLNFWFFMGHPVVWFLTATTLLVIVAMVIWNSYSDNLYLPQAQALSPSRISINPPPSWLDDELKVALEQFTGIPQSLLDTKLTQRTNAFLANLPWIGQVNRIEKSALGLKVQVQYREPVAIVVDAHHVGFAVDRDGIVFNPSILQSTEFVAIQANLMRVHLPQLDFSDVAAWQYWPDYRVQHAAGLCGFLGKLARDLNLYRVVSYQTSGETDNGNFELEIWTRNGVRVRWGSSPGFEISGEADARKKLAALKQFVKENGDLRSFPQSDNFQIDVSSGQAVIVKSPRLAEKDDWIGVLK